jgi:site-specific recombinase XerD
LTEASLVITQSDIELPDALQQRATILDAFENFFHGKLRNPNTRRAYEHSAEAFLKFAVTHYGITHLEAIKPSHISCWLDAMTASGLSAPTVKQRLAALVTLFDSLVAQQILHRNPAKLVDGPSHVIHKGSTPVLSGDEMLQLLDAIDHSTLIGKRDRAMIGTMAYSFARISAVTNLKVEHVFHQKRRLWLRLTDKGGKRKDIPCHHHLEAYLTDWLDAAGHRDYPDAPLFQTFASNGARKPHEGSDEGAETCEVSMGTKPKVVRPLSGKPMTQGVTWEMLQRRSKQAGLTTRICNHTFRATGITAYLSNGGGIERAAVIAGHASINTTKLYDRRPDDVTLDEIEKIRFV